MFICCDGYIHAVSNIQVVRCCGTKSYDLNTHSCCNNNIVYNYKTEICCDGVVHPRYEGWPGPESTKCCGKVVYHEWNGMCCNGKTAILKNDVIYSEAFLDSILPTFTFPQYPDGVKSSYCCFEEEKEILIVTPQYQYDEVFEKCLNFI